MVDAFGISLTLQDQIDRINTMAFIGFTGKIRLRDPDEVSGQTKRKRLAEGSELVWLSNI